MPRMRPLLLLLLALLVAGDALAEPDTFGLGTGRSGALRVETPGVVINRYGPLTADAPAGTRELTVSNASAFVAGELVLLHQAAGLSPAPASGDQRALHPPSTSSVGRFEYARVETVGSGSLRLTAPLLYGYAASVAQVVSVPEYTELEVRSGGSLRAAPWDGSVGGILAALVTGRLRNDGLITVEGAGFRGGAFLNHASLNGCTGLDEPVASGGSYKGEGLVAGRFGSASGRGNLSSGGGGGICHNAGGGGGGHYGLGGVGGRSGPVDAERDVGGLGGAPVRYLPYERLLFGGGGGAGEGNNDVGTGGGAGGGLILLRAMEVRGTGTFRAGGATPPPTPGDDGAGGGGAGGAISLRAEQELECGRVDASGGVGGAVTETNFPLGPGGGGGGGVIFLQGARLQCLTRVLAGAPGVTAATAGNHGAGPATVEEGASYGSEQTYLLPFRPPGTPVLQAPADGATGVSRRPRIEGTAAPGVVVRLFLDGAELVQVVPDGDGRFTYGVSTELAPGEHELRASAEVLGVRSLVSAPNRFEVMASEGDAGTPDGGAPDGGAPDGGAPDGGDGGSPGGPAPPIVVVPAKDERVGPTPLFAGTSTRTRTVGIKVDGALVARVEVDSEGRFRYTLTAEQALEPGRHSVVAYAMDASGTLLAPSGPTSFEVGTPSQLLEAGCGCGASPGAGLGAALLLLGAAWAARRRAR
jgi:MYXO-CTERM domain-containing protein